MTTKLCSKCGEEKPATLEFFFRHKQGKFGLRAACKQCKVAGDRSYMKSYLAEYYVANRDRLDAAHRAWASRNPERMAEFRARWSAALGPGGELARIKRWRAENPEKARAIRKRYEAAHPDARRAVKANRRSRELGAGKISGAVIGAIFKAQRGCCWWCSRKLEDYHLDHRVALFRGGNNHPSNLVLACPPCNLKKSTKMPWEIENPRLL